MADRAEDLLELVRRRDLELVVAAVAGLFVRSPPLKDRRVAEPLPLHVVVLHLAHALDPKRFPGQILAGAPAALPAGHARHVAAVRLGPFAPGVMLGRMVAERLELERQLPSRRHRE